MRWFSHPHPGTRFLRRALLVFALGCVALGGGLARIEWDAGEDALLILGLAAFALPVVLAVMLLWIVLDVLEREGGGAKFKEILLPSTIVLGAAAACVGCFLATRWVCPRLSVWQVDVESKPVVEAIERFRARTGYLPQSLDELNPVDLEHIPRELAGNAYAYVARYGGFERTQGWYDLGATDRSDSQPNEQCAGPADRAVLVVQLGEGGVVQSLRIERAPADATSTFDVARWHADPGSRIALASALVREPDSWRGPRRRLEALLGPIQGEQPVDESAWELRVRRKRGYRELFLYRPLGDYPRGDWPHGFEHLGGWAFGIDWRS